MPLDCLGKHEIGGGVAGVKRDHKVDLFSRVVLGNISAEKLKSVKAELFCHAVAIIHHVGLQIHARHAHLATQHVCEIVVCRKGKVAFAAAEVADAKLALARQMRKTIARQLQKAVDLAEFRLLFVADTSVFVADVKQTQKRLLAAQNIAFLSVV